MVGGEVGAPFGGFTKGLAPKSANVDSDSESSSADSTCDGAVADQESSDASEEEESDVEIYYPDSL